MVTTTLKMPRKTLKRKSIKQLVSKVEEEYSAFTSYLMKRMLRYMSLDEAPNSYFCYLEKGVILNKQDLSNKEIIIHSKPLYELEDARLELFVRHVLRNENDDVISKVIEKIKSKKPKKKRKKVDVLTEGVSEYEKIKLLKQYLKEIGKYNRKKMLRKILNDKDIQNALGIDITIGDRFSRPYLIAERVYEVLSIRVSCRTVYQLLQNKIEMEKPLFKDYTTYRLIKTFVEENPDKYNGKNGRCRLAKDLITQLGIQLHKDTLKMKLTKMMKRGELPYTGWFDSAPRYRVKDNRMIFI